MARISRINQDKEFELLKPLLQTDASYPEHPGYLVNPASERLANDRKPLGAKELFAVAHENAVIFQMQVDIRFKRELQLQ